MLRSFGRIQLLTPIPIFFLAQSAWMKSNALAVGFPTSLNLTRPNFVISPAFVIFFG